MQTMVDRLHTGTVPPFRSVLLRPLAPLLCCSLVILSSASAPRPSSAARRALRTLPPAPFRSCGTGFAPSAFAPNAGRRRTQRRFSPTRIRAAAAMILDSPSAERNKGPIWEVLSRDVLPSLPGSDSDAPLRVLEVAAGCGVHALHFASSYLGREEGAGGGSGRGLRWYPTDADARSRGSVDARVAALPPGSPVRSAVRPAAALVLGEPGAAGIQDGVVTRDLDCGDQKGGVEESPLQFLAGDGQNREVDLVICINMIHIAPWSAALGLMSCASAVLRPGGVLYCYGPYKVGGTAVESNLNFDRSLRMRDPTWGVRDLEEVAKVASQNGLELVRTVEMPANNLSVIFRKTGK